MTRQDSRGVLDASFSRRAAMKMAAALGVAGGMAGPVALRSVGAQDADYPELVLVATEYHFDMPATAESGYNRLTLENQGVEDHHAIFFRLAEGVTPEQFQEVLMSGDFGALAEVGAAYGGPMTGPGGSESVIAHLDSGSYVVFCVIPDAQGVPHVAHGMIAMLEVTEGTSTAPDPVANVTVTMAEMVFEGLPTEVPAGMQTWAAVNNGTQLHEMGIAQVGPGWTAADALAVILGSEGGGATPVAAEPVATPVMAGPPIVRFTGAAPMSPGATNYAELDLVAGEYLAICFVPDAETGVPHALMGMVGSFMVV